MPPCVRQMFLYLQSIVYIVFCCTTAAITSLYYRLEENHNGYISNHIEKYMMIVVTFYSFLSTGARTSMFCVTLLHGGTVIGCVSRDILYMYILSLFSYLIASIRIELLNSLLTPSSTQTPALIRLFCLSFCFCLRQECNNDGKQSMMFT